MNPADWAAVIVGVVSVLGAAAGGVKWLVSHYLHELVPNSGSSMKDRICRIEAQIDRIYDILLERA